MPLVNIPGFGPLKFDDDLSKEQINDFIIKNITNQKAEGTTAPVSQPSLTNTSAITDNSETSLGAIKKGFTAGYEKLPLGIMQLAHLGDPNIVAQIYNENKSNAESAAKSFPKTTKIAQFVGGLAGGAPLMAIPGVGEAGTLPYLASQGALQGGAIGAGQYVEPRQSRLLNTATGALSGTALMPITRGLSSANPYIKLGTGTALGGLTGYELSGTKGGAAEGGIAGGLAALFPQTAAAYGGRMANSLLQKFGFNPKFAARTPVQDMVATDMLQGADSPAALARLQSARNLGMDYLTPAEASSNPVLGTGQAKLGTSKQGATLLQQSGQNRMQTQKKIINDFLDSISPKDAQEKIVKPLYEKAGSDVISPNDLIALTKEPTINNAFTAVNSDPYYSRELKDVPVNSIKYLDQVKKYLDDVTEKTYKKEGQSYLAGLQSKDSKTMTAVMDKASPTYASAREAARKNFIRNDISDVMNNNEISGNNFYQKVLRNDDGYQSLFDKLSYDPALQQKLSDMRSAFQDLIDPMTARAAATLARGGAGKGMNFKDMIHDAANKLLSGSYDKAAVELITNPKWDAELARMQQIQNKAQHAVHLSDLLSRVATYGAVQTASNAK